MRVHSTAFLQQVIQHAKYLSIDTVHVGSTGLPRVIQWIDTASGTYMVDCNMPAGRDFTLITQYHGNPRPEQSGGNWGGVTNSDSLMFAMGVGLNAPYTSTTRHWLPCYDLPDDKADTAEFYFWTDSSEVVAGNGRGDVSFVNGQRLTHWIETKPIASYLLTFAVGPYTTTDYFSIDGVGAQMFALQRDSVAANKLYTDIIAPSVAFYDSLFTPYPFEKVGYVVTPIGSMEHQTMICLDKRVLTDNWSNTTPSHELAHQWWGDWVTCKTFDDAWLNEGFATFCESLIHERFQGHAAYVSAQAANRSAEVSVTVRGKMKIDSLPIYAAATADNHTNNYPATIYKKGAVVLGMLRSYFGDPFFFQALRTYGNTHAYSNVTTADLQQTFESMSGQNLSWFFRQFVYDRGAPVVDLQYTISDKHLTLDLTQMQDSLGYRYFRMPLVLKLQKSGSVQDQPIWLDSIKTTRVQLDLDFAPDTVIVDPDHTSLIASRFITALASTPEDQSAASHFAAFPNPATSSVTIEITTPVQKRWSRLGIFDSRGVGLRELPLDTTASVLKRTLDLHGLAAGSYTLVASDAAGEQYVNRVTLK
jgi:aminopeptidase N